MRWIFWACVFACPALGEEQEACDTSSIRWELPDAFAKARERAVKENRILMIKGVSFGIDKVGAACATKGKW